jgi:low temperature requirement protein LtrA
MSRSAVTAAVLILVAPFVSEEVRPWLWLVALIIGLFGPALINVSAWHLHPAHFVERHGLIIIIIALGESLIAVGLGARATSLTAGVVVAALLGLAIATSFWVAYFDFFAVRFEQILVRQRGGARIALARDVYSYLHLLMIVGIILTAFAMRAGVEHVGHDLDAVAALSLCDGSALYLLSYVAIHWRVWS